MATEQQERELVARLEGGDLTALEATKVENLAEACMYLAIRTSFFQY